MRNMLPKIILAAVSAAVIASPAVCAETALAVPRDGKAAKLELKKQVGVQVTPRLYTEAAAAFKIGRYAAAYGRFMRLADAGHVPSAQAALFMVRNGEALFGTAWSASEDQVVSWNALAINSARLGIEVASFQGGD